MNNSVVIAGGEKVMEKYNFKNDWMVQAKGVCEKCVRILKLLPWTIEALQQSTQIQNLTRSYVRKCPNAGLWGGDFLE